MITVEQQPLNPLLFYEKAMVMFFLFSFFYLPFSHSQITKNDLEKQRSEINNQIELTKKLIADSESKQKLTNNQLAVLNEQIRYREALLQNISLHIRGIENEISKKDQTIQSLRSELEALKKEYGNMILQAYKNRSSYHQLMFVFSANDFNQAYKRFKMTQQYAEVRKEQARQIEKKQQEIARNIQWLEQDREQKARLAKDKEEEKNRIATDKNDQQNILYSLKTEEKKLRIQQKKQEEDRRKLTAKIKAIIAAEIEAERKKEEARKKAEAAALAAKTPATKTTTTTAEDIALSKMELAPEVKIINADFEKNKGSLPWPVSSGIITSHFGRQPHESISGIEINNNGIDFTTEKDGAVLAAFAGTVSSVFAIPGAGLNVIITHGSYKTVYSGLTTLQIKINEKVSAGQKIGTVLHNGGDYVLHFEIWKVNTETGSAQNPELWIKKR